MVIMFNLFLLFSLFLTAVILLYMIWMLMIILSRKKRVTVSLKNNTIIPIDILIPCHHEGVALVETIISIENQKYKGKKNIFLLFKDHNDSSLSFIKEKYGRIKEKKIALRNNTTINIIFTNVGAKKDKLNFFLPKLTSSYVAFLDADHVATSGWLSQSLSLLCTDTKDVCGVQSRRAPKATDNFFQIWDSAQNHLGNEVMNMGLDRSYQLVFFTGTTAVFKSSIFNVLKFANSITEDSYLSYDILLENKHLIYNKNIGSHESVSPTLSDYVARRRRWSNGHNQSFFSHLYRVISTQKISFRKKKIFLFHGLFYFIPILAVLMINIFNGYIFLQYTSAIKLGVIGLSLIITLIINYFLGKDYGRLVADSIITFFYIFPLMIIFSLFILRISSLELYHFIISFPFMNGFLGPILIILYLLPLAILLYASYKIKLFPYKFIFFFIISYPIIIFFDIYAILLGFFDYLFGINIWRTISRKGKKNKITKKNILLGLAITLFGLSMWGIISFPNNNCAESDNVLIKNFYALMRPADTFWNSSYRKFYNENNDNLGLEFFGSLVDKNFNGKVRDLTLSLNGDTNILTDEEGIYSYITYIPLGMEEFDATMHYSKNSCSREITFTNTIREIKGKDIFINNEPFLVKGMVPSFAQASLDLSLEEGINQISSLGVNLLRTYHVPNDRLIEVIVNKGLLFIPQPGLSNWDNNDLNYMGVVGLTKRYLKLHKKFRNNPSLFALNLGNEIEINDLKKSNIIEKILVSINEKELDTFSTYSTFSPYLKYSSNIMSVNMLDTSETYWNKAIPLLASFDKPFIASELGGFAAFFENTDPRIRSIRLMRQWDTLMELGSSGGIIFQSHDNWAQPVIEGYNNPYKPEHPDDIRGIWDRENDEKFVAKAVRSIFEDFSIEYLTENIYESAEIEIQLTNRRNYNLQDIYLEKNGIVLESIGNLLPNKDLTITLSPTDLTNENEFSLSYITHRGIFQQQILYTPVLLPEPIPFIPDPERVFVNNSSNEVLNGDLLDSSVDVYIPDQWQIVNIPDTSKTQKNIINSQYLYEAQNLNIEVLYDYHNISFDFDVPISSDSFLLLEGLGATSVELFVNNQKHNIDVHPYRENIIMLNEFIPDNYIGSFVIIFNRTMPLYLSKEFSPLFEDIVVEFVNPKLFQPQKIIIEKLM
jgi:cellulose synthase/poly-beta-1,6-N-acetylglucosamine synthase-like glycosyltransferase